jgi:2-oxoglutarate ferredoxin oxidoreductase subunit alpha
LPGTPDQLVYADSDEHTEEGHITESAAMRVQVVDKRNRKLSGIASELSAPAVWPEHEAENLVFSFGSNQGVVSEAVSRLRAQGVSTAMVHLSHVWPFPTEAVTSLAQRRQRVITVENNHTGQLAQLLAQECRLRVAGTVRKYDGRQFSIAEVESGLRSLIEGARA